MSELQTQYKYIEFLDATSAGVNGWACVNRKGRDALGGCLWYPAWRQWIFQPDDQAIFSQECLGDIRDFLLQLNRRGAPGKAKEATQ